MIDRREKGREELNKPRSQGQVELQAKDRKAGEDKYAGTMKG